MTKISLPTSLEGFFKEKALVIIQENRKLIIQFIVTALFVYMAVWFITHEKAELSSVKNILTNANIYWVITGLILVILYIFLQGMMYVTSFASINTHVKIWDAIILFLRRNFISVFLPAGGVSSLVFFSGDIGKKGITKSQIYFASSIYAFVGILSVVIVAIPAFIFVVTGGSLGRGKWFALGGVIIIMMMFIFIYSSLLKEKDPL